MNKLTIPTILAATVLVAGIFAFMPVQQASTVHTSGTITTVNDADIDAILLDTGTTLPATLDHLNITVLPADAVDAGSAHSLALANGEATAAIAVLVTDSAGTPVLALVAGDFTGVANSRDGAAVATLDTAVEVSDGLYTMVLDSADFGGAGFVEYILIVTVDDVDNDDTTEVGTGIGSVTMEIIA